MVCIDDKNTVQYPYPTGVKKCEILIEDAQMVTNKDDTSSTLVSTQIITWGVQRFSHLELPHQVSIFD